MVDRGPRSQGKLFVILRHQWRWLFQIFWSEMLFEPPPSAVEPHMEDILARSESPQEVGTKPMFLIEKKERE